MPIAKVVAITTGGTIAHKTDARGIASLGFDPTSLASADQLSSVELEFRSVFGKGSMDIVPTDWALIAEAVAVAVSEGVSGVVVLHGTDTIHYTAAALSFMLQDLSVPVVLTGSMIPGGDAGSDASSNFSDAVLVASRADLGGVFVVFTDVNVPNRSAIIRGHCAKKIHSTALGAIASINADPVGFVKQGEIRLTAEAPKRAQRKFQLRSSIDRNVNLIKLSPATTTEMLSRSLEGLSGVVLEGTGVGHVRTDLQPVVAAFRKPAVMSTQTLHGGERLGTYDVDHKILAIPNLLRAGDLSSEAALVKLMWALGQDEATRSNIMASFGSLSIGFADCV